MATFVKSKLKAARDAIGKRDYSAAQSAASDVLSYEPANYTANVFLGLALLEMGKDEDGERAYIKATNSNPEQLLAWQGLAKLYERTKQWAKIHQVLERLMDQYCKSEDIIKCAETVQKIIDLRREHGTRTEIISALALLLPSSHIYPVLSALPPPDHTAPTATTTFSAQLAVHNSLPIYEEIITLMEKEEETALKKEIDRRRMRLGADRPEDIRKQVGVETWGSSELPALYAEVINHSQTTDELRRATESKLLRYRLQYLRAIPSTGTGAGTPLKGDVWKEVEEMARGTVILGVNDEIAWNLFLETRDVGSIEEYDVDLLRAYVRMFDISTISKTVLGWFRYNGLPISLGNDGSDDDDNADASIMDSDEAFGLALEGFNASQDSFISHRIMSDLYAKEHDHSNAIKISEAGLGLVARLEQDTGRALRLVRIALNTTLATALVHFFPPKYHPRALGIVDTVLEQASSNVDCLLARGYILRYANKYDDARVLFERVANIPGNEGVGLEAEEEAAWCLSLVGRHDDAVSALKKVIDTLDGLEGREEDKARAWWRLGQTLWNQGDEFRQKAYAHFITSLKRYPSYAPAFTSLGIHYSSASPADPSRASKCFQKAVELDPREGDAARRLAEGFAEEREWDLVEVVARRTIEGEGGDEGDMAEKGVNAAAAARYKPINAWAWKAIGVVELNRENFAPAIVSFQIALRADSEDYRSWLRLGEAYSKSGRPVAALKALNRAHALAPDDWTCSFFIGEVYRSTGQFALANSEFHTILATRPDETGVLLALAESFLALGTQEFATGFLGRSEVSFSKAVRTALEAASASSGFRRVAWKTIADALFEASKITDYEDAAIVTSAAMDVVSVITHDALLGDTYKIGGRTSLLELVARDVFDGPAVLLLALASYEYRVQLCQDLEQEGRAAALFDVSVASHAASARIGVGEEEKEKLAVHARDSLKEALRNDPANDQYWNALATVNFESNPKLAQHSYIKALELDPKNPVYWTNLGLLYLHCNDAELANHAFYRAQTLDSEYPLAWVGQAFVAIVNEHFPEANSLLEHAVSLSTPIPQAEYEYARRVFSTFTGSLSILNPPVSHLFTPFFALKRYCGQMTRDSTGLHLFALICERLGQLDSAIEVLSRAIGILEVAYDENEDEEIERRFAIANVNLGRMRLASGDYRGAIDAFGITVGMGEGSQSQSGDNRAGFLRAQARLGTGLAHFHLDQLEDALTSFEGAIEDAPSDIPEVNGHVTILLAQTLWAIGSDEAREAAKTQLLECIGDDPENLGAITTLAAMGICSGNDDLVDAALSEILDMPIDRRHALDPARDVDDLLSRHHLSQGRVQEAISLVEKTLHADPLGTGRHGLALLLLQSGQFGAALEILHTFPSGVEMRSAKGVSELHRLGAIGRAQSQIQGDLQSDVDKDWKMQAQREAEKAVMLAPWERKNWDGLAYIRCICET